jgi:FkbH-like protein
MSNNLYRDMTWLRPAPPDFRAQCRALETNVDLGRRLQKLAAHALDGNHLNHLAGVIERARASGRTLAPLTPFRLGVISNGTSDFIVRALVATAPRHGIALECVEAHFDQVVQQALSPESEINRARPDAVLIAIDSRGLPLKASPGDADAAAQTVDACLRHLETICSSIHDNSGAVCIVQTIPRPVESYFGSLDLVLPGTTRNLIDAINRRIADSIAGSSDLLFDVAALAETVGLADWHDPTLWNAARMPFAGDFVPLFAEHACRIVAGARGKSRRCLILDLDNTLWNGVIGDDGIDGIVIGCGNPTGEAHLDVQRTALALRDRGIILAVSSKNEEQVAKLPFQGHPEMLLKEADIAVFQANWNDKATNIEAIASELSLGLDAMVFLDDNPIERDLVARKLPQVAVPELPADPALYSRTLLAGGYFEAVTFSDEDRNRAGFYRDRSRRILLQKGTGDLNAYLASLETVITFQPFNEIGRPRIAQLINKSNQFNLTTKRYTEAAVLTAEQDRNCFTLQVRLTDRFGDHGMISVVICRRLGQYWEIDTWLMSCRVLGRRVEEAVLQEILRHARSRGVAGLRGIYRPTGRNKLVENHYAKLGFSSVGIQDDGARIWEMTVIAAPELVVPMEVRRRGFDPEPTSSDVEEPIAARYSQSERGVPWTA